MTSNEARNDVDAMVQQLKPAALRRLAERHKIDLVPGDVARDAGVDAQEAERHFPEGVRGWAKEHPEEYVMLWGPPVPDFAAPAETVEAVGRIVLTMVSALRDAQKAGELTEERPGDEPLSEGMLQNVAALAAGPLEGLPSSVIARMFVVWTQLHGMVAFEVNNHIAGIAVDPAGVFESGAAAMGEYIGLSRRGE